jgi:hypothetical protein
LKLEAFGMKTSPIVAVLSLSLFAAVGATSACQKSKDGSSQQTSAENSPNSFRQVRVVFEKQGGLALTSDDLEHAFVGIGAWKGNKPVAVRSLNPGSNDFMVPIGTFSLKATLVSHRRADQVYLARFETETTVTAATEELVVQFGAYKREPMKSVVGILYEADAKPAEDFLLSLVDSHSGAEITLPSGDGTAHPDSRGVYALRTFLGEGSVRMRVSGGGIAREVLLPVGAGLGED